MRSTRHHILQHTATHCNSLEHTATHSNSLEHTETHCNIHTLPADKGARRTSATCQQLAHTYEIYAATHTATHCNALQHTHLAHRQRGRKNECDVPAARIPPTLQHTLQLSATHCNSLQLTATHCNTLQHTHLARLQRGGSNECDAPTAHM